MTGFRADQIDVFISIAIGIVASVAGWRIYVPRDGATDAEIQSETRRRTILRWAGAVVILFGVIRLGTTRPLAPLGEWQPFHSTGGGYRVSFPGSVNEQTTQVRAANGATVTVHRVSFNDSRRDVSFNVSYREPAADVSAPTADAIIGGLSPKWGPPIRRRNISVDGVAGQEIVFKPSAGLTATCRLFPGRSRFCWLTQVVPDAAVDDEQTNKFFESFHFER